MLPAALLALRGRVGRNLGQRFVGILDRRG